MLKIKIGLETLTLKNGRVRPKGQLAESVEKMFSLHRSGPEVPDHELDFFERQLKPLGVELTHHKTDKPEAVYDDTIY